MKLTETKTTTKQKKQQSKKYRTRNKNTKTQKQNIELSCVHSPEIIHKNEALGPERKTTTKS